MQSQLHFPAPLRCHGCAAAPSHDRCRGEAGRGPQRAGKNRSEARSSSPTLSIGSLARTSCPAATARLHRAASTLVRTEIWLVGTSVCFARTFTRKAGRHDDQPYFNGLERMRAHFKCRRTRCRAGAQRRALREHQLQQVPMNTETSRRLRSIVTPRGCSRAANASYKQATAAHVETAMYLRCRLKSLGEYQTASAAFAEHGTGLSTGTTR